MKLFRKKTESGMLTVEAVLSLVPFILVVLGIMSLINIFAVHNRIQYALYQTANEISAIGYIYEATGLRTGSKQLDADTETATAPVNELIDTWEQFDSGLSQIMGGDISAVNPTIDTGKDLVGKGKNILSNPEQIAQYAVFATIDALRDGGNGFVSDVVVGALMEKYLVLGDKSADEYLKSNYVRGGYESLDFSESRIFGDAGTRNTINLKVTYDVQVYFWAVLFKHQPTGNGLTRTKSPATVTMCQQVVVPGWLDGDGILKGVRK